MKLLSRLLYFWIFALLPSMGLAATYTWDGGGDGSTWTDPLNWDADLSYPGFNPANNDVAIIGGGQSVSLAVHAQIDELQLADTSTLALSGSGLKLVVYTTLTITDVGGASQAVINGSGTLVSGGGNNTLTITVNGATDTLNIRRLEIENGTGDFVVAASDVVTIDSTLIWTDGDVVLGASASFYHPGLVQPTGTTMTCNSATVVAKDEWTFNGTFNGGTGEVIFQDDIILNGTSAPTFNQISIRPDVTVTQQIDMTVNGTWQNDGSLIGSDNQTTVASSLTLQGPGANRFGDLTIDPGQTLTLSTTGSNAGMHIVDTLEINGILACTGPNVITIDGTWDNNNGAAGFDEGPDPATNAEGSRVVFSGTTVNLPDVDETFMDLEIDASVKAVARAHYTINRTFWSTEDTFFPSTYTVTFDTSLEHTETAAVGTFDRGILVGEATFNDVHIQSGDTNIANPNKRMLPGSIMKAENVYIDNTAFVFSDGAIMSINDSIVVASSSPFVTSYVDGLPAIEDQGNGFSFIFKDGAEARIAGLIIRNLDSSGLVFRSSASAPSFFNFVSFTKDTAGETGVYIDYQRASDVGNLNWKGLSFDNNCEYNIRTVGGYNRIITIQNFSGAKGGEEWEDDESSGEVSQSTIRWPVKHWIGVTSTAWNTNTNWYDPITDSVAAAAPTATETAVVSTDANNVCILPSGTLTLGAIKVLSGGVVTCNGTVTGIHTIDGQIFVEGDAGDGAGIFSYDANGALMLVTNGINNSGFYALNFSSVNTNIGDVINQGVMRLAGFKTVWIFQAFGVWGNLTNSGTIYMNPGSILGCIGQVDMSSGIFHESTSTVAMAGRNSNVDMGTNDFYNLMVRARSAAIPGKAILNSDCNIKNSIVFNEGALGKESVLKITKALNFIGMATVDTTYPGGATGTIEFSGTAAQTIPLPPAGGDTYHDLLITNTHADGAQLSVGTTTIDGNLNIVSGTLRGQPSAVFDVEGDWFNDEGTFEDNGTQVIFGGSTSQTIGGKTVTTFGNVNIENGTTVDVDVLELGRNNEVEIDGVLRNDGTFTPGTSTMIFTGSPSQSLTGSAVTTFDTLKITGTFNAGDKVLGINSEFNNSGTFNRGTSTVVFSGSDSQITGTTVFNTVTLDSATLKLDTGDDVTCMEWFAIPADSGMDLAGNSIVRLAKGMRVLGTLDVDGSTPSITDTGNDFAFQIAGASAMVDINTLNFANPDNEGLVIEDGVNNNQIDLDGIQFTNDDLTQTGTYLQLQQTTITANTFSFTGLGFDNNCQYNVSTVNNGGVANAAVTINGYTGDRGDEAYENDKGGGSVADQSIKWPQHLWVGGTSSSWNTAANWSPAAVPGPTEMVVIPKVTAGNNTPIIDTPLVVVNSLIIESGGVLTRDSSVSNYSLTIAADLEIKGDEGFGVGVFQFSPGGTSSLSINSNFNNSGTFGTDVTSMTVSAAFNNSSQVTTDGTAITLFGNMNNNLGGTFIPNGSITVSGSWVNNGTFTAGTSSVTMDGAGTITSGGDSFYNLQIDTLGTPTASDSLNVANVLAVKGTLTLENNLTVGTRFDEWTGTIKWSGSGAQSIPGDTYYHLIVDKTASTATVAGDLTVLGNLTLTDGIMDLSTRTLTLEGNFINNATFTESTSTVVFTKAGSQQVQGSADTDFYNLTIDAGATLTINNTASPSNSVTVGDDFSNSGALVPGDASFLFTGATATIGGTSITTFDTLTVNAGAVFSATNTDNRLDIQTGFINNGTFTTGTTTMAFMGSGSISGSSATTLNTLEVYDSLTLSSGSDVTVTTATVWNVGTFTLSGSPLLRFATGGSMTVKGSLVASGSTPTITTTPTSVQFAFTVNDGGGLDINSLNLANLDNNGLVIATTASSSIDIDNTSFSDNTSGATGTYINWQRASPAASEYVFTGLSFDSNCQYNMTSPASSAAGAFTLAAWGGTGGGSAFENDLGAGTNNTGTSSINWPQVVWDGGANTNNWNDAANWSPDGVPGASDNVVIPSTPGVGTGFPKINTNVSVGSVLVEDGATITSDAAVVFDFTISGTLTIEEDTGAGHNGTVTFDSSGTLSVGSSLSVDGHLYLDSGATLEAGGLVRGGGNSHIESLGTSLIDSSGTVTSSGVFVPDQVHVAGDFDLSTGTFTAGTSVVTLDGASGNLNAGAVAFYRLSIPSGSVYTSSSANSLQVSNRLTVGGELNVPGTLAVSGAFVPLTGLVRYNGTSSQTMQALDYYNLVAANTSASVSFDGGTTSVSNNFTIDDGVTALGAGALVQVTGDFINNHLFTAQNATVSFDGSNSDIRGDSTTTFNHLFISDSCTLSLNTTTTPADEVVVSGNWTNDGFFSTGASKIYFNGTSVVRGKNVTTFDAVQINLGASVSLSGVNRFDWGGTFTDNGTLTAGTSTIGTATGSGVSLDGSSTETTFNALEVLGDLTVASKGMGATTFTVWASGTTTLTGSSTLSLGTAGTKGSALIRGGLNTSGTTPTITDKGMEYSFDVLDGGTVNIDALIFSGPDDDGLHINSTASTAFDIDNVSFTGGNTATGTYLQISLASIPATSYTFNVLQFDANTLYNVSTPASASNNAVSIPGWGGVKGGETYENDQAAGTVSTGSILWPEKQWDGSEGSVWTNINNWTPSGLPTASERVIIPDKASSNGHSPYFNTNITVGAIHIEDGGSVTNDGTTNLVTVNGALEVEADFGNGQAALTFDASAGTLTSQSLSNDGTVYFSGATVNITGSVLNTKWFNNDAGVLNVDGQLHNQTSAAILDLGRVDLAGDLVVRSASTLVSTGSVLTFDGTSRQTLAISGSTLDRVHVTGTGTVTLAESFAVNTSMSVNTGSVTAAAIVITFSDSSLLDISANASFDGTHLRSTFPGTDRYQAAINSGGNLWAQQATRFNSLADTGLVVRTGAALGSGLIDRFAYVTFDNVSASGRALDMSGLVAGDDPNIPAALREIRFNGSGNNVVGGVNTPTFIFVIFTGDFGTVATDGSSAEVDPGNVISWGISDGILPALSQVTLDTTGSRETVTFQFNKAILPGSTTLSDWLLLGSDGLTNLMPGASLNISHDTVVLTLSGGTLSGGSIHFRYFGSALADLFANLVAELRSGADPTVTIGHFTGPPGYYNFNTAVNDADGGPVSIDMALISGPVTVPLVDVSAQQVSLTADGTYVFAATVTDNVTRTDQARFSVTIDNVAPTATTDDFLDFRVGDVVTLDGSQSDDANDSNEITSRLWRPLSGATLPSITHDATFSVATFDSTGLMAGLYTFTFQVTDDDSAIDSEVVTVFLQGRDMVPRADAGIGGRWRLDLGDLTLRGHESRDPEGLALSYGWKQIAGPVGTLTGANTDSPTFTPVAAGKHVFSLVVTDAATQTSPVTTVTWIVDDSQSQFIAPRAEAGASQVVSVDTTVTLDGSSSMDAFGKELTYTWSQTAGPPVSLDATNVKRARTRFIFSGVYTFSLVVSNDHFESAADTVTVIAVNTNSPPVADAGPDQTVSTGTYVTLDGSGSYDANADTLSHRWRQILGPAVSFDSRSVNPTFEAVNTRVYSFDLVVNDGSMSSTSDRVNILITSNINSAPSAIAGVEVGNDVQFASVGQRHPLVGSLSTDPDSDSIAYTNWVQASGPPAIIDDPTAIVTKFIPHVTGDFVFNLYVDDGNDRSLEDSVTITVGGAKLSKLLKGTGAAACLLNDGGSSYELVWLLLVSCLLIGFTLWLIRTYKSR